MIPADATHYEFMFQIVDAVKAQGKDVAVLFLSYGELVHFLLGGIISNAAQISHLARRTPGN